MFYYVDCPVCKKDLSCFAEQENLEKSPIYCTHCETALRLKHSETWDDDFGCEVALFWFEKWEEE